jgi:hypothetical protein
MTLLFIPQKFWRALKQHDTFVRTSRSDIPENPAPGFIMESKAELNKKAIKEATLKSRTEEFDV